MRPRGQGQSPDIVRAKPAPPVPLRWEATMDDSDDSDDTTVPAATGITMSIGQVIISVETSLGWTPEMVEDTLIRVRRQVVAAIMDLGLVGEAPARAEQTP